MNLKRHNVHEVLQAFLIFAAIMWIFVTYVLFKWIAENEKQTVETKAVVETVSVKGLGENEISVEPVGPTVEEEHLLDERYCLALNIYHESRGDSFAGQAAVADVVMNRVEDDYYPDTVCEVVKQTVWIENWKGNMVPKRHMCQFSWFCDGVSDEPGDPDAWMESYMLAEEVFDAGNWRGITEGATHYHSLQVRPKWVKDRGMEYTGTVGQHEFYRWER